MKKSIFIIAVLGAATTGCHNSDIDFDDFDYQTIYFSKQSPLRTITLGDDGEYDTSLDNAHKFYIKAALGGVNVNTSTHSADFVVDNSMCDNVYFEDGTPVKAMPASYYEIKGDKMVINRGEVIGGVEVQLSDAFFADPETVGMRYVIPVRLTASSDSILQGKAKDGIENPNRLISDHWAVQPKDYVFYAVNYKNKYHGCWTGKGTDVIENNGETTTVKRLPELWEKGTLRYLTTKSLTTSAYTFTPTVPVINEKGKKSEKTLNCELLITIGENGEGTVSTESEGCSASGTAKWTYKGEPKAWGDKDRDLLELSYTFSIDYVYNAQTGQHATYKLTSDERMVMQNRQNKLVEFKFTVK